MDAVHTSRRYPQERTRAGILSSALVQPLGACMIPVMLGALTAMLTARPPLIWLTAGFPAALSVAFLWTIVQLQRRVVQLRIREEAVLAISSWDLLTASGEDRWRSVLEVRSEPGVLLVTMGHDTRRLDRADWERPSELESQLRQAADAYAGRIQSTLG